MPLRMAVTTRNAAVDAEAALANDGWIRIYTGAQPATPEAAVTGALLAELRFGATAFGAGVAGVITANAITADAAANATGTAGWARCFRSDGTTAWADTSVTAVGGGGPLELDSVAIQVDADVAVDSFVLTLPM